MNPTSDLPSLYRSFPAYLWVEDQETRTYLQSVWDGEANIEILVAGGHTNLHAVVNAAREYNVIVLGFRDRDFGRDNRARWGDKAVVVLTAEAVEIENLLLDPEAIAACDVNTSGRSAAAIDSELRRLAAPLTWWMSCRRTITEMRDQVIGEFLEHPSRGRVKSQQEAEDVILKSPWWTQVLPAIPLPPTWVNSATVTDRLVAHEKAYQAMLVSDAWRREFSGKEILRDLTTKIWTQRRPSDPAGRIEFIRSIGKAQLRLNRVPPEILELRAAILKRIGR